MAWGIDLADLHGHMEQWNREYRYGKRPLQDSPSEMLITEFDSLAAAVAAVVAGQLEC